MTTASLTGSVRCSGLSSSLRSGMPRGGVFAPPRAHPLLGLRQCAVSWLRGRSPYAQHRPVQAVHRELQGQRPVDGAVHRDSRQQGQQGRAVLLRHRLPKAIEPAGAALHGSCTQCRKTGLTAVEFAASAAARPLASFGLCSVASCTRVACGSDRLCGPQRPVAGGPETGPGISVSQMASDRRADQR